MSDPQSKTTKLGQQVLKNTRYLVVVVSHYGLIKMLECPGLSWCVNGLRVGRPLPEVLQAIVAACEPSEHASLFPYVQLADDENVNVHVLKSETGTQIILHDVSEAFEGAHKFQQKAHDVSLLLEREVELSQMLARKQQAAELANEARRRFIATMSDEFRSPISSIMAHAEALRAQHQKAREPVAIQRASWYLLTLLENLLEQARKDKEERRLDLSEVEVSGLLKDMSDLFETQAKAEGVALDVSHDDDAILVLADEIRLRQVLFNLLNNALQNTSKGSVSLDCQRQGDELRFTITDTGKGIAATDLDRVFEPFTKLDRAGDSGAGLGLTVSRQLVEAMQGELSATSTPGTGSTFSFALPVPHEDQLKNLGQLDGLQVLVVEHDTDLREMYRDWLQQWGARVRSATGFEQAVSVFAEHAFDLVLADLFLDDGNGVDLLTKLREKRPELATVLCSSSDSIEMYLGQGGTLIGAFIRKPLSAKRLEEALRKAIGAA